MRGWLVLLLTLTPALSATAFVPGFVSQDGPAHVYNAHILVESFRPDSPFRAAYETRWSPLPNWAGHLVLMGLVSVLHPLAADQAMLAITMIGVSGSAYALRRIVRGREGDIPSALFAALLGLNFSWLFGFYSFLIGTSLFALTLGYWWSGRDRPRPARSLGLAALLIVGYFAHLVSLALTAMGLVVLAVATPGDRRKSRIGWTAAGLVVLVPLALVYKGLSSEGGGFRPTWHELTSPISASAWTRQLAWIDPLSLGRRLSRPFGAATILRALLTQPVAWMIGALAVLAATTRWRSEERGRRGWTALAAILLVVGLIGPDSFGPNHGDYLPQRVLLLALIALLPVLDFASKTGTILLAGALVLQSAYVWDYAWTSRRLVDEMLSVRSEIRENDRVGTLLLDLKGRFRPNPLLHADCLLGVGTGAVIWSNYEAAHYYFPVHFRPGLPHPPELEFERISVMDAPSEAPARLERWRHLLESDHDAIDVLVIRGDDARLEEAASPWYRRVKRVGRVQVWRRRDT